jgi:hypothetical protein
VKGWQLLENKAFASLLTTDYAGVVQVVEPFVQILNSEANVIANLRVGRK